MKSHKINYGVIFYIIGWISLIIFLYYIIKHHGMEYIDDVKEFNIKGIICVIITCFWLFLLKQFSNKMYIFADNLFRCPSMITKILKLSSRISIILFSINILIAFIFLSLIYFNVKLDMKNIIASILFFQGF